MENGESCAFSGQAQHESAAVMEQLRRWFIAEVKAGKVRNAKEVQKKARSLKLGLSLSEAGEVRQTWMPR